MRQVKRKREPRELGARIVAFVVVVVAAAASVVDGAVVEVVVVVVDGGGACSFASLPLPPQLMLSLMSGSCWCAMMIKANSRRLSPAGCRCGIRSCYEGENETTMAKLEVVAVVAVAVAVAVVAVEGTFRLQAESRCFALLLVVVTTQRRRRRQQRWCCWWW